jgi:16S rRNA pseudouridine516 synthase
LSAEKGISRKDLRPILAQGRVTIDGVPATHMNQLVQQFTHITLDEQVLRAETPIYLMMNKPAGVVSATKDDKHQTVIDLIEHRDREKLHIVGRLDYSSTGLILLTNDGRWSRALTKPDHEVAKRYRVKLENPVTREMVAAFEQGMHFPFENITTRPAKLTIVSQHIAEVSLVEGRYHQIKRMFGRYQNAVLALDRIAIGALLLDPALRPAQSRTLTTVESKDIFLQSTPSLDPINFHK